MAIRAGGLFVALVVFAGLLSVPPGADASHWCGDMFVTVTPSFVPVAVTQEFTIRFENTGVNDSELTFANVRFSWESSSRNVSVGSLPAGAQFNRTVSPGPVPSGLHTVTITLTGTNEGHPPTEVATCVTTRNLAAIETGEIFGALVMFLLAILVIVVIVVVVVLLLIVRSARKKGGPPTPPVQPPVSPPEGPPLGPSEPTPVEEPEEL